MHFVPNFSSFRDILVSRLREDRSIWPKGDDDLPRVAFAEENMAYALARS
jgi:hypothetical protein